MTTATSAPPLQLDRILKDPKTHLIVCCGSGGVGKTTTAAALALRAAEHGRKTVVLTIDPARRLAQALGVENLDNDPQPVDLGPEVKGQLQAMMLNMKRTFDDMVIEHAPDKAESIFANPVYQTAVSSFGGTQEYMAMEKLGQLSDQGIWDLIVVDTPPSRNALDFLDAPKRLGNFLDGRMIRIFMAPGRGFGRFVTGAMGLALKGVSTIVGGDMLSNASVFIQSLDTMFGGFRARSQRTFELLSRPGTNFVVVSAAEPDALREASFFVDRLSSENMPLAGLVLNRTHPTLSSLSSGHALTAADQLDAEEQTPETVLAAGVLRVHAQRALTDKRETHLLQRFTGAHPRVAIVGVPSLPYEVTDLDALRAVADQLTKHG